ncbi:MAG TPA: DUF885 family protein, partial [Sphingomicrobium sp.]
MSQLQLTRRETVAALAASAAFALLPGCKVQSGKVGSAAGDADASKLLDSVAENLLRLSPEGATSLGIDTGNRASLRTQLSDRSAAGQQKVATTLKSDLARAEAVDTSALSFPVRTSVEVVKSAYKTALEGFALPYGDIAVGGWRNTPYVVIQNVGAYLDTPKFLDTDHPIENASDAEAYLTRLSQYPKQLDGELERMKAARGQGLVPPNFLIDKAISQLTLAAKNAHEGDGIVDSIVKRTKAKNIAGDWDGRTRKLVTTEVAPALERQIEELNAERASATDVAGMWSRPRGPEFYAWALKASTTTNMSPDEVHAMGLEQLNELQGRMDPILKSLGYTQGSVGERMKALAKDPKYKFSDGDPGRAEIMAYIQERIKLIRAQLPRAFNTLVPGHLEVKRMPPEEEPGAPGAYGGAGSIDGKIPGKFWIN